MSETTGLQMDAKSLAELKARGVLASIGPRVMLWMGGTEPEEGMLVSVEAIDHESGLREVAAQIGSTDAEMEWIAAASAYMPKLIHDYELLLAVATAVVQELVVEREYLVRQPITQEGNKKFAERSKRHVAAIAAVDAALRACGLGEEATQ